MHSLQLSHRFAVYVDELPTTFVNTVQSASYDLVKQQITLSLFQFNDPNAPDTLAFVKMLCSSTANMHIDILNAHNEPTERLVFLETTAVKHKSQLAYGLSEFGLTNTSPVTHTITLKYNFFGSHKLPSKNDLT